MNGKKNCKFAFSMAEALVTMLVVALLVAATVPVFTKKHRTIDKNTQHGKWACKYINGELHSARAADIDDDLPPDNEWAKGCVFPGTGKNVKYLYVEVYGAGGGGSEAKVTPWTNINKHIKFGEQVPIDGDYKIYMAGSGAGTAQAWNVSNPYNTTNNLGNLGSFYDEKYYPSETVYCTSCFSAGNCCKKDHEYEWTINGCSRSVSCNCGYKDSDGNSCTPGSSGGGGGGGTTGGGNNDNNNNNDTTPSTPDRDPDPIVPDSPGDSNGGDDVIYRSRPLTTGVLTGGAINIDFFNKYSKGTVTGGAGCSYSCSTCTEEYDCNVYQYSESSACYCSSNHGTLPSAQGGAASNAVEGTVTMKEGERIDKIALGTYKEYSASTVNGYPVTGATDAEGYKYLHQTATVTSGGGVSWKSKLLAKLTGGTAGHLGTSGTSCCYNCGNRSGFPNSAGGSPHCATNGIPGKVSDLASGLTQKSSATSAKPEGLYIDLDKFEYKVGCHGQAGGMTASLLPVANARNFKFQVGKGGPQKDGNPNGEDTFFSWVTAAGGKGAFKGCYSDTTDVSKAKVANNGQRKNALNLNGLSDGGLAGTVTIHDHSGEDNGPRRDYKLSRVEDSAPKGRWTVEEPGRGLPGMIVVSW